MRIALGIIIGGIVGFIIGYFLKCVSGTCPLVGNPIVSTLVCALLGGMLAMKGKR